MLPIETPPRRHASLGGWWTEQPSSATHSSTTPRGRSTTYGDGVVLEFSSSILVAARSDQWECKTDMDNAYRFGKLQCVMATPSNPPDGPPPSYDDTFRSQHPPGNQPPPYGFREDYTSGGKQDSCSSGFTRRPTPTAPPFNGTNTGTPTGAAGSTGGGFWSGAFTGGLLGYMFGNRNSTHYGYQRPRTSWWGGNGYGNGGGWGTGWGNGGGWGSGWGNGGGW
ncbi:hypothetical protein MAR_037402, partial [Mya arenaria]